MEVKQNDAALGASGEFIKGEQMTRTQYEQVRELYIGLMRDEDQYVTDEDLKFEEEDVTYADDFLRTVIEFYILTSASTGRVIAFLALDIGNPNEVSSFFVQDDCRGLGLGSVMLMSVLNRNPMETFTVFCYEGNTRALKFYKRNGFVFVKNPRCEGVLEGVRAGLVKAPTLH